MKKLTTIILILIASFVFADVDNEMAELVDLAEQIKEVNRQKEITDYFISQRIYQLETQPKFMASRLAFPNTYLWYIWNDFDEATGFNKLEIAEDINNLTK